MVDMKRIVALILIIIPFVGFSQYLGLPGDNLNLFAVLDKFQKSPTLEIFEEDLNNIEFKINNLDLDLNNQIDYISVYEIIDNENTHLIKLQTQITEIEKQDIAIIIVERKRNKKINIQIIGDIELYGKNYIIKPSNKIYTNSLPIITYIFKSKNSWTSNWCWANYPPYFRPWVPLYYHQYYGYHNNVDNGYTKYIKIENNNNAEAIQIKL